MKTAIEKTNELLKKESVISILETTAQDSKTYSTLHYNLDAVMYSKGDI